MFLHNSALRNFCLLPRYHVSALQISEIYIVPKNMTASIQKTFFNYVASKISCLSIVEKTEEKRLKICKKTLLSLFSKVRKLRFVRYYQFPT